ncbi:MAG: hypothetical protein MJ102_06905 [Clostridia bacterium]|nr:hypothetical protein [Clostridia bacterium]
MQYYEAGGVPVIEGIVDKLAGDGVRFLAVPLMLAIYLALDVLLSLLWILYGKTAHKCRLNKTPTATTR